MPVMDPVVFDPVVFDTGEPGAPGTGGTSGITVRIMMQNVSTALQWRTLSITESIGAPDTCSIELVELTDAITDLLGPASNFYYLTVHRFSDLLFSGVATGIRRRNNHGAVTYALNAVGWEFLAPKRLVGRPDGSQFLIQEEDDPDRLPTAVAVDPSATDLQPVVASVQALFAAYWNAPLIDTDTYVTEILPDDATVEELSFSGTDIDGVMNTLCAAGSTAAMWWIANDSPDPQSIIAPHLALHFGLIELPADGDPGDDLVLVAPYAISDEPDWTTSIMASAVPELESDQQQRVDAVYVRGATGYTEPVVVSAGVYVPGAVVVEGGSGWVGTPGGLWGDAYVDAPAAISPTQRDAFGNATLAARGGPSVSGDILVETHHGWHKGQAVNVTDAGLGLAGRWLLIRSVSMTARDSAGESMSYRLTVGDILKPDIARALRQQRLQEARKEIRPATKFIPFVGDLQLDPAETAPLTMQLANEAGRAMAVKGVRAEWHLYVNGTDQADVEDTGELFWLTDIVEFTDELGQITATLHAGSITGADACKPWAEIA